MVDAFSGQFQNFMNELSRITSTGNYDIAPKINPVAPKNINFSSSSYPSGGAGFTGGSDTLSKLMRAIRSQESGGNYKAYNNMYGASGAYQILKSNFANAGGWDREALGRDISYQEFMNSPAIQDEIAKYKLQQYLNNYGSPAAAAVAWYGGPGAVKNMYSKKTQTGGYPSIYAYWNSVLSKM